MELKMELNEIGKLRVSMLPACKGGWTLYETETGAIRAIKTAALEAGWNRELYSLPIQGSYK